MYEKITLKECWDDKYETYDTVKLAQQACSIDNNCQGVYDAGCNAEANDIYLCPKAATYGTSGSSCIYQKSGGKFYCFDILHF